MKLTKMIYLASPFSHKSKKIMRDRCLAADKAIGVLQNNYPYAFIGPITQSARTVLHMKKTGSTFKDWARRDLTYISRCDEVWVLDLPGWSESVGVQAEIIFADSLNLPLKFVNYKNYRVTKMRITK